MNATKARGPVDLKKKEHIKINGVTDHASDLSLPKSFCSDTRSLGRTQVLIIENDGAIQRQTIDPIQSIRVNHE